MTDVYVGYAIDEYGEGVPIAAGEDHDTVFNATVQRNLLIMNLHGQISVQKRDISPEDAATLEALVVTNLKEKGLLL